MSECRLNCIYCEPNGLSKDTGEHLYVNRNKAVFFCQRCNATGVWVGVLPTAKRYIESRYKNIELFNFSIKGQNPLANKAYDYIIKRLPENIVVSKTRWSPDMQRVFFPLWVGGRVRVWNARAIDDSKPKYLTYGQKSRYIYGLEDATDWAVLCEGPLSALSTPGGIAIFGKSISDTQVSLIVSKFKKIYWALDFDTIGQKSIEEQKDRLRRYIKVIDLNLPDGYDPNDVGFEGMEKRISEANKI